MECSINDANVNLFFEYLPFCVASMCYLVMVSEWTEEILIRFGFDLGLCGSCVQ